MTNISSNMERYIIHKTLGSGSMGEVWLAEDTLLDRPVAIKYLNAPEDPQHRNYFLAEARMLANLNHPKITQIYDAVFDEDKKQFYLVMEYVEGNSLFELTQDGSEPIPLAQILSIAIDILEALEYAHQRGVVHRDIKPGNIMIENNGVKLADFGLAGLTSQLTQGKNTVVGTPDYISPEQIQGKPTDGRSDLYSLGIVLFKLITGGFHPFEQYQKASERLKAHLREEVPSLKELAPTIPLALETVILQLLAKKPTDRYESAAEVLSVIRPIQSRLRFNQPHLHLLDLETKPLIGRQEELTQLETIWSFCRERKLGRLCIVRGENGIGKSRFIAEFLGHQVIDKGAAAFIGRCDKAGTPYAPYAEILAVILDKGLSMSATIKDQVDQLLDQVPLLARLLHLPKINTTAILEKGFKSPLSTQWQFFNTILTILHELGPTVLVLKDAIYLDEASIALTKFLIEQTQIPLLVIATYRSDLGETTWTNLFSTNQKATIDIPPLSLMMIKTFLENTLGGPVSDSMVSLANQRSEGNPLHLEITINRLLDDKEIYQDETGQWRYIPAPVSPQDENLFFSKSLIKAFTRRVNRLSDETRETLAIAALIEPDYEFEFDVWVELLGGESKQEIAQTTLAEGLKKRVLRTINPKRYMFHPPDVGQTLSELLPLTKQGNLHRQIAQILQNRQADPTLVAHHYQQAGLDTEAARYLEEAGVKAIAANMINPAIVYYKQATNLVQTIEGHKMLGILYRQKGEWANSIKVLEQAISLAQQKADIDNQAQLLNELTFTLRLDNRYQEAYIQATQVIKLSAASPNERGIAQSHLGMIFWVMGRLQQAEKWCQQSVNLLKRQGNQGSLAGAYNQLSLVYLSLGKLNEAQTIAQRSLYIRQELGDYWGQGYSLAYLGAIVGEKGNFRRAWLYLESAQILLEAVFSYNGLMFVYTNQGRVRLYQKQPHLAMPLLHKALDLALKTNNQRSQNISEIYLLMAQACLANNWLNKAQAGAEDALKRFIANDNPTYIAESQATLAEIYATQGNIEVAEPLYKKALVLFHHIGHRPNFIRTQRKYARFLNNQGRTEEAQKITEEALSEAKKIGLYLG